MIIICRRKKKKRVRVTTGFENSLRALNNTFFAFCFLILEGFINIFFSVLKLVRGTTCLITLTHYLLHTLLFTPFPQGV